MPAAINYVLSWRAKCYQLNLPPKKKALPVVSPTWSAHKTALHDYSMTNMSSDVDPFALSVALPDQSGHLFGMLSGSSRCLWSSK